MSPCSEYNHIRNSAGECVLIPGAVSLASENTCTGDDEFWYERTAYRRISKSQCVKGTRLDRGIAHHCHGHWFKSFVSRFWWTLIILPIGLIALAAVWYYRRQGSQRGFVLSDWCRMNHSNTEFRAIRLPDTDEPEGSSPPSRLSSISAAISESLVRAWDYLRSLPGIPMSFFGSRRRRQDIALDDDA